jgi:hypothetical protein
MMKGFPITAILVPVESGSDGFALNAEILAESINNAIKRRTVVSVLDNQMRSFVPGNPFTALDVLVLQVHHFSAS